LRAFASIWVTLWCESPVSAAISRVEYSRPGSADRSMERSLASAARDLMSLAFGISLEFEIKGALSGTGPDWGGLRGLDAMGDDL